MAIRQSDERFLMNSVWPALVKAEALLLAQDRASDLRYGEAGEYPVTAALTKAIDDLALRIDRQSGLGSWRSIKDRLEDYRLNRCGHGRGWVAFGFGNKTRDDGTAYTMMSCVTCGFRKEVTLNIDQAS